MDMTEEQIYEKTLELAEQLSAEKRDQLIEELRTSAAQPPGRALSEEEFDARWAPVVERRLADIESGRVKTIPWSEVKRKMRERRERRAQSN